eukprot:2978246-Pleurochrysis_carterae.AAC.1
MDDADLCVNILHPSMDDADLRDCNLHPSSGTSSPSATARMATPEGGLTSEVAAAPAAQPLTFEELVPSQKSIICA